MNLKQEEKPPPSVLLVRLSSLGDIVQAIPLAAMLSHRGHRVGWLIEARFRDICSLVDLPVEWQTWERGWSATLGLRRLRGRYDLVCDLQGNWKSALCGRAIAGGKVWRPAPAQMRESASVLIRSRHSETVESPHILLRSLAVVEAALGSSFGVSPLEGTSSLLAPDENRRRLSRQLQGLGVPVGVPFIVQVLGPPEDPRTWPLEKVLHLAAGLDVPQVLLGGPAEEGLSLPQGVSVLRQEQGCLGDLVALGNLLADQGGVAVGHDGGAMHVLRASGAKTLFLFGPQDPARTGPLGESVLLAPIDLPCRPCLKRSCDLPEGNLCMDKIPAEVVRRELERLFHIG